jgi:hypothetical protein
MVCRVFMSFLNYVQVAFMPRSVECNYSEKMPGALLILVVGSDTGLLVVKLGCCSEVAWNCPSSCLNQK